MQLQVKERMTINAPAKTVWRILAHEFHNIGAWSSGIYESKASQLVNIIDVPQGAPVGGRICYSDGFGGDVEEKFTSYDEEGMRFSYQAVGELPSFMTNGENSWYVEVIDEHTSRVGFNAEMGMKLFPGIFLLLFFPILKNIWGTRTLEELKYYIENEKAHPRKQKQQDSRIHASG